jgi:hypothetical protein
MDLDVRVYLLDIKHSIWIATPNFIVSAYRFLGNPLAMRVALAIVIVRIALSMAAFVSLWRFQW